MILKALRPCPFCGNSDYSDNSLQPVKLIKKESSIYGLFSSTAFMVKCHKCFASAGAGVVGYNSLTRTTITEEEAQKIAIEKWNQRA